MKSRKSEYLKVLFLLISVSFTGCNAQVIPEEKLNDLVSKVKNSHSDGFVIYQGNRLIKEWYAEGKSQLVDIKSVTKSMTNLAVGYLVSQGKLAIDEPVHTFYPEWNQERKRDITIRHLLTHTSGLLDSDFALVENTSNIVQFALTSDLTHPVGKYYVYNNKAVNLLAGIIEKADGRKLDQLMKEEIFDPLGIITFEWPKDKSGNPYVMAFLKMYPQDLAKIGLLVLNKGKWEGKQLIDASWFTQSMKPGFDFLPEYGLLWELMTENFRFVVDDNQIKVLKDAGIDKEIISKAEGMKGQYKGYGNFYSKVASVFGKNFEDVFQKELIPYEASIARKATDLTWGYAGIGYLGQYLILYPEKNIVAVRLINQFDGYNWDTDELTEFPELVKGLIK